MLNKTEVGGGTDVATGMKKCYLEIVKRWRGDSMFVQILLDPVF